VARASGGTQASGTASRSVQRAIDILGLLLSRDRPVAVSDIVSTLGIPKSSAYELVRTLTENNYLERETSSAYRLGRKLLELGTAYHSQVDLLKEGARIIEELCHETGETTQLSVLEDGSMLVLLKEESSQPIRIISRVGSRVPVNWAAAGRLLVSDLDDAALREVLQRHIKPSPTGKAKMDVDGLIAQIRQFRKQGYGTELGEANAHAGCIAAPVLDASGHCVAAISLIAPEQRLRKENREFLVRAAKDAARKLSHRLGTP
jgi:DNA-binding IclR family transcriptional regulator